jgi:hypothetical protein
LSVLIIRSGRLLWLSVLIVCFSSLIWLVVDYPENYPVRPDYIALRAVVGKISPELLASLVNFCTEYHNNPDQSSGQTGVQR